MSLTDRYDVLVRDRAGDALRVRHRGHGAEYRVRFVRRDGPEHARSVRSARALGHLTHPHILRLVDVVAAGDRVGLVSTCPVDACTLPALVARGPLSHDTVATLGTQVLDAVASAHVLGVFHGALEPDAVLVGGPPDDPIAAVGRFGVRGFGRTTTGGRGPRGPEQDVVDLGRILHLLLTRHEPDVPPDPRRHRPTLLPSLGDLVVGAIEGVDGGRRLSAAELRDRWVALSGRAARGTLDRITPPPVASRSISIGPPTQGTDELAAALAPSLDVFIGRRVELAQLRQWLDDEVRLSTITGIGGLGKSRLATEFANSVRHLFPGGVHRCDLTDVHTADGLCEAVGRGLALRIQDARPSRQIGHALAARPRLLLLLDDIQDRPDGIRETVAAWLAAAPGLTVIATSRVPLYVDGEHLLPLEPLSEPDARRLYVERCASGDVGPVGADTTLVDDIVTLLDRVPLAIELAARRSELVPPRQLRDRLRAGEFPAARGGATTPRHRTMERVFDDQWSLLQPSAQRALAQCAVFAGSFTHDAAEAVIDLGTIDGGCLEDVLFDLVDFGLVEAHHTAAGLRFGVLRTLRHYASRRLSVDRALGVDANAARDRHAAWYQRFGRGSNLYELPTAEEGGPVRDDLDNVMVACRWAISRKRPAAAARCAIATWRLLLRVGPPRAAKPVLHDTLAMPGLAARHRGRLLACLAEHAKIEGDPAGVDRLLGEARAVVARDPNVLDPEDYLGIRRAFADLAVTLTEVDVPPPPDRGGREHR